MGERNDQIGDAEWPDAAPVAAFRPRPATQRNDEVGDLARLLKNVVTGSNPDEVFDVTVRLLRVAFTTLTRGRGPDDTIKVPMQLLFAIIAALDYVPRPRGNLSRKIRGRGQIQESLVLDRLRRRKRELMDQENLSAIEAELQVAEEEGPKLFLKRTGRGLSPETIRRLMQRRSRRPHRKTDT